MAYRRPHTDGMFMTIPTTFINIHRVSTRVHIFTSTVHPSLPSLHSKPTTLKTGCQETTYVHTNYTSPHKPDP
jgi:predicted transcriptional regulator